jgi:hypothetical protein
MRHPGHDLGNGKKGLPHFQTEGKAGHTFYGFISSAAAVVLTPVLLYDHFANPFESESAGVDTCPPGGCQVDPKFASSPQNSSNSQTEKKDTRTTEWSIDAGRITGNRMEGTRICQDHENSC